MGPRRDDKVGVSAGGGLSSILSTRQKVGLPAREQDWREAVAGKLVRGRGDSSVN